MARTAAGAGQVAAVHARHLVEQHAQPRGLQDLRREYGANVPESARLPHARPPGEQQLLLAQHEHRPRRLRVVRRRRAPLAAHRAPLPTPRRRLPQRLVVARPGRGARGRHTRVSLLAEARRPRLGQRRMRALGAGVRLVQQRLVERRSAHARPVRVRHRALRVQQAALLQEPRAHGPPLVAVGAQRQVHRSAPLRVRQARAHALAQAVSAGHQLCGELWRAPTPPGPPGRRAGALLLRLRRRGLQHPLRLRAACQRSSVIIIISSSSIYLVIRYDNTQCGALSVVCSQAQPFARPVPSAQPVHDGRAKASVRPVSALHSVDADRLQQHRDRGDQHLIVIILLLSLVYLCVYIISSALSNQFGTFSKSACFVVVVVVALVIYILYLLFLFVLLPMCPLVM